ncbi:TonB-dependent receptor [Acidithiobacillus thiooxidans]|uniref:TonB-dependent receptor n=1 Tax=Acidithiobacillus thiooxidans ATCC 19377 TaxID=637390 RepID=A0A543Q008_ACITH|nr:TonB-dependent receptor [Acidithiobacillus thiooxidans]MDX5936340.1 TonB-dependent receptor [Acidithiobacillus thiooxidans]TQN49663.1 hypothetical protein DLNHIDIE_03073 [Acidithiobacillus thiooxidans ATCC 19377]
MLIVSSKNLRMREPIKKLIALSIITAIFPAMAFATDASNYKTTSSKTNKTNTKVYKLKKIRKAYNKLQEAQKNVTTVENVISKKEIENSSSSQSIYSILKKTPFVNEYQQNIGPGVPVLTVRGVKMQQLGQTLDGVPIVSLLNGGLGGLLSYNVGGIVTMGQINGIHVYPGASAPDVAGFGSVGGTIAYKTKKPSKNFYTDLTTKIGSYGTNYNGITINTGNIPDTDGLRTILKLAQTKTDGYIQNTPAMYTDFMFGAVKPYDDGLSKVTATVIYNRGQGYYLTAPIPIKLIDKYGPTYNYPLSTTSFFAKNTYLTAILGDSTYINKYLVVSGKVFFIRKTGQINTYLNPKYMIQGATTPYQIQYFDPYGEQGPISAEYGNNYNFSYNPLIFGSYPQGEDYGYTDSESKTIGFTPKATIFLPHNTLVVGGLIASETEPVSGSYLYGSPNMPHVNGYNSDGYGTIAKRTVYTGYIQDKISLFNNKLHIQPGITISGVASSNNVPDSVLYYTAPYSVANYIRTALPYLGVAYDITNKLVAYASYGRSARYAPVGDFVQGPYGGTTVAPGPEIGTMAEVGMRYVGKRTYLNFDMYRQNLAGIFSSYYSRTLKIHAFGNIGAEQFSGLEFSGKYIINHNFTINGSAGYNRSIYTNAFPGAESPFGIQDGYAFTGNELGSVPNVLANLGIDFHNKNFNANLNGQYVGSAPSTVELPFGLPGNLAGGPNVPDSNYLLPSYFLLNVGASYKFHINTDHIKYIKLSINIDNLLDRNYFVHQYRDFAFGYEQGPGVYRISSAHDYGLTGEPRFIEVGLTGRFI